MDSDRPLSPAATADDIQLEPSLRPRNLEEYGGDTSSSEPSYGYKVASTDVGCATAECTFKRILNENAGRG